MKLRTEIWRIMKFVLITGAVNLVFSLLNGAATNSLVAGSSVSAGQMLSLLSCAYTILTTLTAVLLNRYFTFRATEPWYIAVPVMLIAAVLWQMLRSFPQAAVANLGAQAALNMSTLLGVVWLVVSYLIQRCVIYCHTTDQNGWFRRFHPAHDE